MSKKVVTRRQRKAAEAKRVASKEAAISEPQKKQENPRATRNGSTTNITISSTSSSTITIQTEKKINSKAAADVNQEATSNQANSLKQAGKALISKISLNIPENKAKYDTVNGNSPLPIKVKVTVECRSSMASIAKKALTTKSLSKLGKKMVGMIHESSRQRAALEKKSVKGPPCDNSVAKSNTKKAGVQQVNNVREKQNSDAKCKKVRVPPVLSSTRGFEQWFQLEKNKSTWAKLRSEFLHKKQGQIEDAVFRELIQKTFANDPESVEMCKELSQTDMENLKTFIRNSTEIELQRELDVANILMELGGQKNEVDYKQPKKRKSTGSIVKSTPAKGTERVPKKKAPVPTAKGAYKNTVASNTEPSRSYERNPCVLKKKNQIIRKETNVLPPTNVIEPKEADTPPAIVTDVAPYAICDQPKDVSGAVDTKYIGNTGYFVLIGTDDQLIAQIQSMSVNTEDVSKCLELTSDKVKQQLDDIEKNREQILNNMRAKYNMISDRIPRVRHASKYSKN